MAFADVVARGWNEHRLFSVLVELTYRCNLDCFFCYNDLSRQGRLMETDQWLRLLDELAAMGVMNLALSGGEPLSHPDFLEIGRHARDLGFVVRIKSNGHTLRGELARRILEEVDPFKVEVSLHGARAETHDRQTRIAGSFDRLMANLGEVSDLGYRVQLNSTLTRWNEDELEGMYELADRFGFPLQVDPDVTPRDDGDPEPFEIRPSREAVTRYLEIVDRRARSARGQQPDDPTRPAALPKTDKHCGAGSNTVAVDPFGNVYPCVQWRRPVGSLHERSIVEIWSGEPLDEVRELNRGVHRLKTSGVGLPSRFCPGSAELQTGSPLAGYGRDSEQVGATADSGSEGAKRLSLPVVYP